MKLLEDSGPYAVGGGNLPPQCDLRQMQVACGLQRAIWRAVSCVSSLLLRCGASVGSGPSPAPACWQPARTCR